MTVDKRKGIEPQPSHDDEIESFRRDLDSLVERKRSQFEGELQQALNRIEILSEESEKSIISEWNVYEVKLSSAKKELYKRSREEMSCLLGVKIGTGIYDEAIRTVLENIIPEANSGRMTQK